MPASRALTGSPQTWAHTHIHTYDHPSSRSEHQRQVGLHGRLSWFRYFLFGNGVIVGVGGVISQIPHFPAYSLSRADPRQHEHVILGGTSVPLQSQHRSGKEATPSVGKCWSFVPQHSPCCSLLQCHGPGLHKGTLLRILGTWEAGRLWTHTQQHLPSALSAVLWQQQCWHSCHWAPYTPIKRGSGAPHPPWELA